MIILGLILLLLALLLGFLAYYGLPTADTQIGWDFLGTQYSISPVAVFFIGAGTMLGLLLGLYLLLAGSRRSARKARELRELKRTQKETERAHAERARQEAERRRADEERIAAEHQRADEARRAQAYAEQELRERRRSEGGSTRG